MAVSRTITERQAKWFAALRDGLERETGKSLEEWVAIARACPHEGTRARLSWLKHEYGLGQNRGSLVLAEAFPPELPWRDSDALLAALWTDPAAKEIYVEIAKAAQELGEVTVGPRKSYVAFSRNVQFAAARPVKGGNVRLGLALPADESPRLEPAKREAWSERLTAVTTLTERNGVDRTLKSLLRRAWERS